MIPDGLQAVSRQKFHHLGRIIPSGIIRHAILLKTRHQDDWIAISGSIRLRSAPGIAPHRHGRRNRIAIPVNLAGNIVNKNLIQGRAATEGSRPDLLNLLRQGHFFQTRHAREGILSDGFHPGKIQFLHKQIPCKGMASNALHGSRDRNLRQFRAGTKRLIPNGSNIARNVKRLHVRPLKETVSNHRV